MAVCSVATTLDPAVQRDLSDDCLTLSKIGLNYFLLFEGLVRLTGVCVS